MTDSIQIDTGEKHIAITDGRGNVKGEIVFNPADLIFAEKFYALFDNLKIKELEYKARAEKIDSATTFDENNIPSNAKERLAIMQEICLYFRAQVDDLFGENTSKMAFGDTLTFDVFQQFFTGITPYFQRARGDKVNKYINTAVRPKRGKK